jgi:anti-sigma-K factor RskA
MPSLVIGDTPAEVVSIGVATRSSRRLRKALSGVAFAAAALIVVLALSLLSAQNHVTNLQSALKLASRSAVQRAMATPGHQVVNLTSATGQRLAKFVMLPDGTGYLVKCAMPNLASNDTYQLWGIVKGSPVSIGVMGSSPGQVTFTLNSSPGPSELAVTVQKAGGSLTPAKKFVASGPVDVS